MITFKDVSFKAAGCEDYILRNINLKIQEGSCVVFTGKSGCGKTTLTRCINGLIPDVYPGEMSGEMIINGTPARGALLWNFEPICGSVFQDPRSQFFTTNTTSEVAFAMENYGVCTHEINRRIDEVMTRMDIDNLRGRSVFKLSSGEKQKVALASAVALKPKVLVLDEPSSNLDIQSTLALGGMIKRLKAEGYTIIVSEHRLYYLRDVADKIIYIDKGKIEWEAAREEISKLTPARLAAHGLRSLKLKDFARKGSADNRADNRANLPSEVRLDVSGVAFKYGRGAQLLKNITFSALGGEIIGIIGANGKGKTTLLRVLSGLMEPQAGSISMNGVPLPAKKRIKASYFVMQDADYQLYAESVSEEVTLGCPHSELLERKRDTILSNMGIKMLESRHPGSLSGGQKQRVVIAAMLVKDVAVLLLDEPTSGLDYESMKMVSGILKLQSQQGKIICIISHDYEFLNETCTRILHLDNGEVVKDFNMSEDNCLHSILFQEEGRYVC
ncbi:energy-coupling factor transport system ATP-binding protein [Anaerobacterium chartisolvens]|uniref:Energy-coupling factor transport system ATP-binding protein n=1 Tax=Anaerobacterium chartisolvens TaxID=1297424 RepID=A0A369BBD4_9FIRM|nr:ABC transporter ATP-binding protein [Anaerobacterium chartisolvens]RCX18839.1 energy-coupling factor transport system ATP-binding protein [Anaerobacterium chartisolvens]